MIWIGKIRDTPREVTMKYTPLSFEVNLRPEGFVVDLGSLFSSLMQLHDKRDARGLRYTLVTVLVYIILAKLSGENFVRGMADWVKLRQEQLAEGLGLAKAQAPHATTYTRILGHAIDPDEFQRVVRDYFAHLPQAGSGIAINLDGKTVRGTIPAGATRGLHQLAAYLPGEGWVLLQGVVESQENEIVAAPRVLNSLDLRGKVVTADALLAQRDLSIQIVEAGGDAKRVWTLKDNQPETRQAIETLFQPDECGPGLSGGTHDFRTAHTTDKAHGRLEQRTITISSELKEYLDWPYCEQVFKLERHVVRIKDSKVMDEVVYGLTSLTADEAGPEQVLDFVRGQWGIENGLHYRRDATLREDWCCVRIGHAPQMLTLINNVVLGLLSRRGVRNVPEARRRFAAHLNEAIQLVLGSSV
jgi:predicted transposase YbfD/YdcC